MSRQVDEHTRRVDEITKLQLQKEFKAQQNETPSISDFRTSFASKTQPVQPHIQREKAVDIIKRG